jgi:hypothetical protein
MYIHSVKGNVVYLFNQEIKREKKEHREVFLGLPLPLFSFGLLALTILDLFGR